MRRIWVATSRPPATRRKPPPSSVTSAIATARHAHSAISASHGSGKAATRRRPTISSLPWTCAARSAIARAKPGRWPGSAVIGLRLGGYQHAAGTLQQALILFQEIGSTVGESQILPRLGDAYLGLGRYEQAAGNFDRVLCMSRELGDPGREADALNGLGEVHFKTGNADAARAHHATALRLASEVGSPLAAGPRAQRPRPRLPRRRRLASGPVPLARSPHPLRRHRRPRSPRNPRPPRYDCDDGHKLAEEHGGSTAPSPV